jgi:hypothetical protein
MRPEDELERMHGSGCGRTRRIGFGPTLLPAVCRRIAHCLYRFRPQSKHASKALHKRALPSDIWARALSQTDSTGQRASLAIMASADWVQTKGLGLALCSAR